MLQQVHLGDDAAEAREWEATDEAEGPGRSAGLDEPADDEEDE